MEFVGFTIGVGFTVIVKVIGVPVQTNPLALNPGVTVTVAVKTVDAPAVATN
jgi:hypothetical protein